MYLEIKEVKKSYGKDSSYIQVLKGITTSVEKGQMCVIQGTSGSGKSTAEMCYRKGTYKKSKAAFMRRTNRCTGFKNIEGHFDSS